MTVLHSSWWSRSITWNKLNWNTIDTVAFICRRFESLPFEDVTQVTPASSTSYLGSPSVRIRLKQNHQISKLMVKDHVHCQKHLAARTEITICLPLLCIRKHLRSDLWLQEDLHRKLATHIQNRIWWQTYKAQFHSQHSCKTHPHTTCCTPQFLAACALFSINGHDWHWKQNSKLAFLMCIHKWSCII